MTPEQPESLYLHVAVCLLVLLPLWYFARQYAKDARARGEGRGDERYAWLRRSHPNHPALPPAPPKPAIRTLSGPWRWRNLWIYAAQAAAIGALAWVFLGYAEPTPQPKHSGQEIAVMFGMAVVLVAFATAVLTHLWDLLRAALARRVGSARQRQ